MFSARTLYVSAAIAVALALPGPAAAQSSTPVIRPGDPAVDGTLIEPHRAVWRAVIGPGDASNVMAVFERKVRGGMVRGDSAILVLWDAHFGRRSGLDLFAVRPRTLEPLYRYVTNSGEGGLWVLNFHPAHVSGSYTEEDGAQPRGFQIALTSPIFPGGGVLDLVLAAIDLEHGSSFTLRLGTLDARQRVVEVSFQIGALERIERPGAAPVEARIVDGVWSSGQRQRLWIAREPPYLVRREITMRDGNMMSWELIELNGARTSADR